MWPPNKNPPGYFPPTSSSIAQNTQNHQISSFSQEQHIPPSPQPSGSYYNHGGLLQMVTGQGQPFQNMPVSMFSPTFGNMNSQQQYFGNNALLSNQQQYFWHPGQTDNRTANKTTLYSLPTYHYWNQQQQQYTMPQGNENYHRNPHTKGSSMDIPSSSQMADYKFMIPLSHSTPLAEASSSRLSIDTEAAEGKPRPKKKKKASVVPTPHHGIHQRQRTNINNSAPELIPETASSLLHPHKTFIPDKSSAEHQPKAHLVVPSTSAAMISSTKSTSCNSSPKSAFQWPSIISVLETPERARALRNIKNSSTNKVIGQSPRNGQSTSTDITPKRTQISSFLGSNKFNLSPPFISPMINVSPTLRTPRIVRVRSRGFEDSSTSLEAYSIHYGTSEGDTSPSFSGSIEDYTGVHFSGMQMMSENQRLDGRALPLQSIQHTSDRLTPLKQSKNPRHNKESDENDNVITNTGNRYSQRTDDSGIEVSNNTSTISGENVNSTNTGASSSHRESSAFATCFASISDIEKQSDGLFSETSNTSYRQQEITNKSAAESIFTMDPHSDGFFDLGFPTPLKNLDNSCWMFTSHNTFIPEQVSGVLESSSFIEDFCRGNSNTFNRSVNNIHEQHLNPHPCGETNIISQFKECPPINASKTPKNEGKGRPKKNNRKKSDDQNANQAVVSNTTSSVLIAFENRIKAIGDTTTASIPIHTLDDDRLSTLLGLRLPNNEIQLHNTRNKCLSNHRLTKDVVSSEQSELTRKARNFLRKGSDTRPLILVKTKANSHTSSSMEKLCSFSRWLYSKEQDLRLRSAGVSELTYGSNALAKKETKLIKLDRKI